MKCAKKTSFFSAYRKILYSLKKNFQEKKASRNRSTVDWRMIMSCNWSNQLAKIIIISMRIGRKERWDDMMMGRPNEFLNIYFIWLDLTHWTWTVSLFALLFFCEMSSIIIASLSLSWAQCAKSVEKNSLIWNKQKTQENKLNKREHVNSTFICSIFPTLHIFQCFHKVSVERDEELHNFKRQVRF